MNTDQLWSHTDEFPTKPSVCDHIHFNFSNMELPTASAVHVAAKQGPAGPHEGVIDLSTNASTVFLAGINSEHKSLVKKVFSTEPSESMASSRTSTTSGLITHASLAPIRSFLACATQVAAALDQPESRTVDQIPQQLCEHLNSMMGQLSQLESFFKFVSWHQMPMLRV